MTQKGAWIHSKYILRIPTLLSFITATTVVQTTIISRLSYCNDLMIVSPLAPASYIHCSSQKDSVETLVWSMCSKSFKAPRHQSRNPYNGLKALHILPPLTSLTSFPPLPPSLTLMQPRWPPHWSSHMLGTVPLQDHCSCCFLPLELSCPDILMDSSFTSCRSLFKCYLLRPSLTTTATSHHSLYLPCPPFYFIFSIAISLLIYHTIY